MIVSLRLNNAANNISTLVSRKAPGRRCPTRLGAKPCFHGQRRREATGADGASSVDHHHYDGSDDFDDDDEYHLGELGKPNDMSSVQFPIT